MSEFKHIERIDAYLEGRLSDEERQGFEADLLTDDTLRAEFDACRAADKATELMAFRGMMERIREGNKPNRTLPTKGSNWWWAIGVACFVALVLGWLFFALQKKQPVPQQSPTVQDSLPEKEWPETPRTDSLPPTKRLDNAEKKTVEGGEQQRLIAQAKSLYELVKFTNTRGNSILHLDSAAVAFDGAKFQLAAILASSVNEGEQGYQEAQRITAHAYFNLGEYEKAALIFQKIVGESGDAGRPEQGYLMLSWLAAGKSQSAEYKALLKEIRKDKFHPFYDKSLKIK
jgi:tetratricopeptide (TPR) repeat protein